MKVAIVVSHPIQHFCPQYASWAKAEGVELKILFGSNLGAVKYIDPNFKQEIQWSNLYLDEFSHEFLNGEVTFEPNSDVDALNLGEKLNDFAPDLLVLYGYTQNLSKRARKWALQNRVKIGYISDAEHRQKRPLWKEVRKLTATEDFSKVGQARTPMQYFIDVINIIREVSETNLPVTVFSDGSESELKEVLQLPNVKLAEDDLDILQMLHLSKSKIIVLSAGSTFGQWAGFLSNAAIINHYQHFHSYIRPKSVNEKTFEGVIDFNTPIDASLLKYLKKLNS